MVNARQEAWNDVCQRLTCRVTERHRIVCLGQVSFLFTVKQRIVQLIRGLFFQPPNGVVDPLKPCVLAFIATNQLFDQSGEVIHPVFQVSRTPFDFFHVAQNRLEEFGKHTTHPIPCHGAGHSTTGLIGISLLTHFCHLLLRVDGNFNP